MPTRYPHGLSGFGVVLTSGWAALPLAGGTEGKHYWVDTANGSDSNKGESPDAPSATIANSLSYATDGVPAIHHIFPGQYAESVDVTKRNQILVGETDGHNGIVQIIGDGSTARATVRVLSDYVRGFGLFNVELDTNGLAQPCLHIQTSDTGTATATANSYRFRVEGVSIRSTDPRHGLHFEGATLGLVRRCLIMGPTFGITFTGSANNMPADIQFEDIDFMDCVTADVATIDAVNSTIVGTIDLTNIQFLRLNHWDRGGTPVTNYVNMIGTMVNTHFFDGRWARDVADDTLMVLPANVVAIGHSAAGVESIIGA